MPPGPRMTIPAQLVLQVLLEDPQREIYGRELGEAAGLPSGTIHPILARLEGMGWLESRWEDIDPSAAGRPARRYYRLTPDGAVRARDALARAYRARSPRAARPAPGAT
ncbi:MAG TPA: helix-turn-helix transcriptional regulator [Kineosporiaceae bacterium]|nr:helix-turn-helix transcriptional regulator [Kineosporiaceae bacterium]